VLVRLDDVARCIVNANDGIMRATEIVEAIARDTGKVELAAYLAGQLMLELLMAKFLEPCTPDFIEPLHGN
jgi:hypothetical protein